MPGLGYYEFGDLMIPEYRYVRLHVNDLAAVIAVSPGFGALNGYYRRGKTESEARSKLPLPPEGYRYVLDTRRVPWKD